MSFSVGFSGGVAGIALSPRSRKDLLKLRIDAGSGSRLGCSRRPQREQYRREEPRHRRDRRGLCGSRTPGSPPTLPFPMPRASASAPATSAAATSARRPIRSRATPIPAPATSRCGISISPPGSPWGDPSHADDTRSCRQEEPVRGWQARSVACRASWLGSASSVRRRRRRPKW